MENQLINVQRNNIELAFTECKNNTKLNVSITYFQNLLNDYPSIQPIDMKLFVETCLLFGANPMKKEIYLVPYWNSNKRANSFQTVVAYQFYIKRARECGGWDGHKVETDIIDYFNPTINKMEKTIAATATVYAKGSREPVNYVARYKEFVKTNKQGQATGTWAKMPYLMLEKCALCNAMRQAFPEELHGIYTAEELTDKESPAQDKQPAIVTECTTKVENPTYGDKNKLHKLVKELWPNIKPFEAVALYKDIGFNNREYTQAEIDKFCEKIKERLEVKTYADIDSDEIPF